LLQIRLVEKKEENFWKLLWQYFFELEARMYDTSA